MIVVKIKRFEYEITSKDLFMDNGQCVQLLTQSKERAEWGRMRTPVLSKKAVKEISKYKRVQKEHKYHDGVEVFSLELNKE